MYFGQAISIFISYVPGGKIIPKALDAEKTVSHRIKKTCHSIIFQVRMQKTIPLSFFKV